MHRLLFALIASGLMVTGISTDASAWSEANCRELCRLTSSDPPVCVQRANCPQYRGGSHASSEYIRARAQRYHSNRF